MSNIYPSLEDFKYDILIHSKHHTSNIGTHLRSTSSANNYQAPTNNGTHFHLNNHHNNKQYSCDLYSIYPSAASNNNSHYDADSSNHQNGINSSLTLPNKAILRAPLSGFSPALKMQPSNTIRAVLIYKDSEGRVGLRLAAIQGGVFVVLVYTNSPAANSGLRFGDQILEVNDITVAGYSMQKVHELIKKASYDELRLSIRDRPFERTVTLHKDHSGHAGFVFSGPGKITSIVKDSSAARNGLLIDHNILEVNGQNVVGLGEIDTRQIIDNCGDVLVLTVMPSLIYELMIKQTDAKLLRNNMDHSLPEIC